MSSSPEPSLKRKGPDDRSSPSPGEYEAGRVICHDCAQPISIRDHSTNDFTVKHWDAHRLHCPASAGAPADPPSTTTTTTTTTGPPPAAADHDRDRDRDRDPVIYTPESTAEALAHPPAKRRRAKRTEEERIEYLRADPYVAQFEAYRVLCASCHKWIRLRPNSTYCSIPWDAHRKSCLAKKVNSKNVYALEERNNLFGKDPDVRKFDAERVLCNLCDKWINVPSSDHLQAVQKWLQHRADCQKPSPPKPKPAEPPRRPPSPYSPSFHDLGPANYPPPHESRRRNAEQRAATLRADKLIGEVEPNRVFCLLCQKWVQLRQDSSYCAYPWIQHRNKCEKRHQRHERKAAAAAAATTNPAEFSKRPLPLDYTLSDSEDSDDLESEDADKDRSRKKHPRDVERYIAWLRGSGEHAAPRPRMMPHPPTPPGPSRPPLPSRRRSWHDDHNDPDADGDVDAEGDLEDTSTSRAAPPLRRPPVGLADLDSPAGRRAFISASVSYLFATTYEPSDDMSISTLLTYLNAAMPQDKHEDFDTTEVVKAVTTLQERGRVVLRGDILHLRD